MAVWALVRHGESTANRDGWLAGELDAPLTDEGRRQAVRAAEGLGSFGAAVVHTSPQARASATADIIARALGARVAVSPDLRERELGVMAGKPVAAAASLGAFTDAPEGGESLSDATGRAIKYLRSQDRSEPAVVVTHGALLRGIVGHIDKRADRGAGLSVVGNGETIKRETGDI